MIEYEWIPGSWARQKPKLLDECAQLYSLHYGRWSSKSLTRAGERVRLSSTRLKDWFQSDESRIATARHNSRLVGYAIAVQAKVPSYGFVSWVTQLVVQDTFRRQGVATDLLFSIWGLSDHFAWGLVSANPYAVRALEKATRRRCVPKRIARNRRKLVEFGSIHVPYIQRDIEIGVSCRSSTINTAFFVDHSAVNSMTRDVETTDNRWRLGEVPEGWEWFAFTFQDQPQIELTSAEVRRMLDTSDQIVKKAYSRMKPDVAHKWAAHTDVEVRQIIEYCALNPGEAVLDLGCGAGRHAKLLAEYGIRVTGVDYVEEFVEVASHSTTVQAEIRPKFVCADCRTFITDERFDAAICLYDVIGTYSDNTDNMRILQTLARHLRPGGFGLLSVMNLAVTLRRAKQKFSIAHEPNKLLELRPSRTMEKTGNIFDPEYYLVDPESRVIYRKEQFVTGNELPAEWIVRDRRFEQAEIESMCRTAGLDVIWSRLVRAGGWAESLGEVDDRAKEILVLCRKASVG